MRSFNKAAAVIFAVTLFAAGCGQRTAEVPYDPNVVKVVRENFGYEIVSNDRPYYIKGVGVGKAFGKNGENYLAMAKEMGANTVRTWGTDQGDKKYLDEAYRQGLMVNAGIWLNYVSADGKFSYLHDAEYLKKKEEEALDYVRTFKDHPAVLMWNIGNEAIYFTKSKEEKIALARYLEILIQKVKILDPNHPVTYASVNTNDLPYLKDHVPSLDIVGMNVYGSVIAAESRWKTLDFDIPYMITEFGPTGPWDASKDVNGKVQEATDYVKATQYRNLWNTIRERRGKNVGGFSFHLGETTQESLTYWNLNDHGFKKESFRMMQKLYNAIVAEENHAPRVNPISGVPNAVKPGSAMRVSVSASDPEGDPLTYSYAASTTNELVMEYYVNEEVPIKIEGKGESVTLYAPQEPGVYRIYAFVRDDHENSSVRSKTLKVQ
ncbi:MAG TPA: glycoside hydrolase family 2 TIM barrel-domain containing protein [Candidatus Omnitrophota bacterium]|nr:glycoside hydrolase family 2 TIM barrel-domain containing protein [Candidatus Omnitrophota bacterium]